jgi:ketosteroid isomerase-like protein
MGEDDRKRLLGIYRLDWATVGGRRTLRATLAELLAPGFDSRLSSRFAGRWEAALDELRAITHSLEHDFQRFTFEPADWRESRDGRFVVFGGFTAVARASQLEVGGEFGHVWTVEDGRALSLEGYPGAAEALSAAGLAASEST